jgi:DNA-directed RNA polymerase subunit RPC12/RpoP
MSMNMMKNKREMIKCYKCGIELVFDENSVEEIDRKVYCKKCSSEIKR